MKDAITNARTSVLLLALALVGCSHDTNQPVTLQQQRDLAKGYAPTKEQLASAMSRFKTPGSTGGQTFGAPTSGPGAGK